MSKQLKLINDYISQYCDLDDLCSSLDIQLFQSFFYVFEDRLKRCNYDWYHRQRIVPQLLVLW